MIQPRQATVVEDYQAVLQLPRQEHLVIVGGQAVSIWADRYLRGESELHQYLPFTSKDLDVLGDASDLIELARATGFRKVAARRKILIPSAGFLEMPRVGAEPVKVEVLKRIYGVTTEEARSTALMIARGGLRYRVLHPLILLKAKVEAAVHLPQDLPGQERQDARHLKMMVICVRCFLTEVVGQVEAGKLAARDCLNLLEETLEIAAGRTGRMARKKYDITWESAVPLAALQAATNNKLQNFVTKRWPRWALVLREPVP